MKLLLHNCLLCLVFGFCSCLLRRKMLWVQWSSASAVMRWSCHGHLFSTSKCKQRWQPRSMCFPTLPSQWKRKGWILFCWPCLACLISLSFDLSNCFQIHPGRSWPMPCLPKIMKDRFWVGKGLPVEKDLFILLMSQGCCIDFMNTGWVRPFWGGVLCVFSLEMWAT